MLYLLRYRSGTRNSLAASAWGAISQAFGKAAATEHRSTYGCRVPPRLPLQPLARRMPLVLHPDLHCGSITSVPATASEHPPIPYLPTYLYGPVPDSGRVIEHSPCQKWLLRYMFTS